MNKKTVNYEDLFSKIRKPVLVDSLSSVFGEYNDDNKTTTTLQELKSKLEGDEINEKEKRATK